MVQNEAAAATAAPTAHDGEALVRLTAALASSNQTQESLHTQLRSQSADLDHLEAENTEQRAVIKSLRADISRLQAAQQADARDLVHLAGRFLALSQRAAVELDTATKEIYRRRGWTTAGRRRETIQ